MLSLRAESYNVLPCESACSPRARAAIPASSSRVGRESWSTPGFRPERSSGDSRPRQMSAESIDGIFLTHEHNDHASGASTFSTRWGCPIFATAGTADAIGLDGSLFAPFVRILSGREGRIGSIGFRPLAVPHDANESVVYAFEADEARMVIASDLGRVEECVRAVSARRHDACFSSSTMTRTCCATGRIHGR